MRKFVPLILLLFAGLIVSCKSATTGVGPTSTHGVDAQGNVWMDPPPPEEGLQIDVQPFVVPDSAEVQGNFYLHLPSQVPFDVERIEIAMNQGTHHMNLYRSTVAWPPDSGIARKIVFRYLEGNVDTIAVRYQAEFNATIVRNGGDMMVEAQVPYLNWSFPKLPDGTQSAVHFGANDTLVIENHYVNISSLNGGGSQTTPNGMGKVIINLWRATSGPVTQASMMFARKTNLYIPAKTDSTFQKDCRFGTGNLNWPIYILGITGHYHSRGKQFWVDKRQDIFDASGNVTGDSLVQSHIYYSPSWDEPPFTAYDPPIQLNKGQYIRYYAEYVNLLTTPIVFGPHVAYQEHMNLFTWFAPGWNGGQTLYDDLN
jgi:hypothetical protein